MGTFILLCALASTSPSTDPADPSEPTTTAPPTPPKTTPLSPDQQVEAWSGDFALQPTEKSRRDAEALQLNVVSVALPLLSVVVGIGAGFGTAIVFASRVDGTVIRVTSVVAGALAFDVALGAGLAFLLPPGFSQLAPAIVVAIVDVVGTVTSATAVAGGIAYFAVVYRGRDCICGGDVGVVPLVGATFVVGSIVATSIITTRWLRADDASAE